MMLYKKILFSVILILVVVASPGKSKIEICSLTTEYKTNPIGIGEGHPRLSWKIKSSERNVVQLSYQIIVATNESDLKRRQNLVWDSEVVISSQSIHIVYAGITLKSRQRVYWQVMVETNRGRAESEPAFFEMGLLSPTDWQAEWIRSASPQNGINEPLPYFRKAFNIEKEIEHARLYASALGVYKMQINGEKVGDEYFTPYWTSYHHRIQYQVYDISGMIRAGENAVGMLLGNGWARYFRSVRTGRDSDNYFNYLAGIAQIEITYTDGTKSTISTDASWKSSSGGLLLSTIYSGEIYDSRKVLPGWDGAGFNEAGWQDVEVVDHPKSVLVPTYGAPVIENETLKPVRIFHTSNGKVVADMGQNMVGWIRLKVSGKSGEEITLTHAEVLDMEGNLYTDNLRSAHQEMKYVLDGRGEQVFEPQFSFQGFRYVQIEGMKDMPTADNITGIVVHSEMPITGGFKCSDSLINQLQHNILWGQKGNFLDVPTDCPQRDERLGWTGDAQVFASTACFNMFTPAFFTKWLQDLALDQDENGRVSHTVPNVHNAAGGAAGWADAALIVPWTLYQYYGDKNILERQYASMKAWVDFMTSESKDNLWFPQGRQFGDWLSFSTNQPDYPGAYTEKELICNAYFAYSTHLLSKIAKVLENNEDAVVYARLFEKIKAAYINEFITPSGRIASETQTAYVLSLNFNLVPQELIPVVAKRLADNVNQLGHITTGFLGTNLICPVLSQHGYSAEAYKLLNQQAYPSWLYPVTRGATTIWERWDGIKPDGSFQDPGMNSFNHYAYGAIGDWLYRFIAGINPDSAGFKTIRIKPEPGGGITMAEAWHESMYGRIESGWKLMGNKMQMKIVIPPNTTAEVYVPSGTGEVTESGRKLGDVKSIGNVALVDDYIIVQLGSGIYSFESQL